MTSHVPLVKSEQTKLENGAMGFRVFDQKEVTHYADFDEVVAACDKANRVLKVQHYVMNDSGKEYYTDTWID